LAFLKSGNPIQNEFEAIRRRMTEEATQLKTEIARDTERMTEEATQLKADIARDTEKIDALRAETTDQPTVDELRALEVELHVIHTCTLPPPQQRILPSADNLCSIYRTFCHANRTENTVLVILLNTVRAQRRTSAASNSDRVKSILYRT
jgi:hypothetical protein